LSHKRVYALLSTRYAETHHLACDRMMGFAVAQPILRDCVRLRSLEVVAAATASVVGNLMGAQAYNLPSLQDA